MAGESTIECDGCGGVGFIWAVSEQGAPGVERCAEPDCGGQQTPVTLPRDMLDPSLYETFKALRDRGPVTCAQVWERSWPRQKVWRVRLYLPSGIIREARDARWLNRAALRLLQALRPKGDPHGVEDRVDTVHSL